MAKGFTQDYGNDYDEKISQDAYITSVHTLLAITATRQ